MSYQTKINLDERTIHATAEEALKSLSDKGKVNFALALLMKVNDPDAAACLRFAGSQLAELANVLMRKSFERERG